MSRSRYDANELMEELDEEIDDADDELKVIPAAANANTKKHPPVSALAKTATHNINYDEFNEEEYNRGDNGQGGGEGEGYEDDYGEYEPEGDEEEGDEDEDYDEYNEDEVGGKNASGLNEEKTQKQRFNKDSDETGRPYQNPLCKPVYSAGKTKLGLSQARLFGLLDQNGQVKIVPPVTGKPRSEVLKHTQGLSKPPDTNSVDYVEEKLSFKPEKSKKAEAAMRDPKCGYDFVERLNNRGDFLSRADQKGKGGGKGAAAQLSQFELDQMEQDYGARLDKLMCPKCKRAQTFDEFIEKKRTCSMCGSRFEKLNVSSGANFQKKLQQTEELRRQKLQKIELEMYGKILTEDKAQPHVSNSATIGGSVRKKGAADAKDSAAAASAGRGGGGGGGVGTTAANDHSARNKQYIKDLQEQARHRAEAKDTPKASRGSSGNSLASKGREHKEMTEEELLIQNLLETTPIEVIKKMAALKEQLVLEANGSGGASDSVGNNKSTVVGKKKMNNDNSSGGDGRRPSSSRISGSGYAGGEVKGEKGEKRPNGIPPRPKSGIRRGAGGGAAGAAGAGAGEISADAAKKKKLEKLVTG